MVRPPKVMLSAILVLLAIGSVEAGKKWWQLKSSKGDSAPAGPSYGSLAEGNAVVDANEEASASAQAAASAPHFTKIVQKLTHRCGKLGEQECTSVKVSGQTYRCKFNQASQYCEPDPDEMEKFLIKP